MAAATMKRDRLGRFLSPGTARQRGSSGGSCGSGRSRGRPSRTGGASADGAAALAAAQLSWGSTRSCGDTGEDGTDEAGGFRASSGRDVSLVILRANLVPEGPDPLTSAAATFGQTADLFPWVAAI